MIRPGVYTAASAYQEWIMGIAWSAYYDIQTDPRPEAKDDDTCLNVTSKGKKLLHIECPPISFFHFGVSEPAWIFKILASRCLQSRLGGWVERQEEEEEEGKKLHIDRNHDSFHYYLTGIIN